MSFEADWRRCAAWIDAALEHAGHTHDLADVADLIKSGDAQFWPGKRSALVTEITRFPRATILTLWLAGGDLMELIKELRPKAEAWGQLHGCDRSAILGRAGWERALCDEGYRPAARMVIKDLAA